MLFHQLQIGFINACNTDTTGSTSIINGSIDSTIVLAVSGNVQTSGTLEITQESDANSLDASSFPNNFSKY